MIFSEILFAASQVINTKDVQLPNKVNNSRTLIPEVYQTVLIYVFGIMGAIAVLMITLAALQYVLSSGDSQKISKAKDTILYALIGLAVAVLGYAIIQFGISGVFG